MGKKRVIGIDEVNCYHVVSRIVDRRMVMGDGEKRMFRRILGQMVGFSGVGCVTFCLMGNHFHLLLEVRDGGKDTFRDLAAAGGLDDEIVRRVSLINGANVADELRKELAALRGAGKTSEAWKVLEPLVARMNDLASFVKELKWRFSSWYNGENGRVGTLWESRFRSLLVEREGEANRAVAAYIDLNPVRAGLVSDPKDYRFCGYAEAVGGSTDARAGLRRVVSDEGEDVSATMVLARYRSLLFGRGGQRCAGDGTVIRSGFSEQAIRAVGEAGGDLSRHEMLRCRIRYLTDGAAIGSKAFLDRLFEGRREFFGERRKSPGSRMCGGDWGGLHAVRNVGG